MQRSKIDVVVVLDGFLVVLLCVFLERDIILQAHLSKQFQLAAVSQLTSYFYIDRCVGRTQSTLFCTDLQ